MLPVEINRFRAAPENRHCFDCGARMDPSWVSITFSVSLCLNCSGKHRQLGVHVSFVRSLEMDKFSPEQLVALEVGGNARAAAEIPKPVDYSSRQAIKYSETLKSRVDQVVKDGYPKVTEDVAKVANGGAFIYSATGSSAKPAWAK